MKNIFEIIKEYGLEVPAEKQKEFEKAVLENYKTVRRWNMRTVGMGVKKPDTAAVLLEKRIEELEKENKQLKAEIKKLKKEGKAESEPAEPE